MSFPKRLSGTFALPANSKRCLRLMICVIALCAVFSSNKVQSQVTFEEAFASLGPNRDRILTEYAHAHGYLNAYHLWQTMSASQKGVFLTITDLLGRRTYMTG